MKSLKQIMQEVLEPDTTSGKIFKLLHKGTKKDYPVDVEDQFTSSRNSDYDEDVDVCEAVYGYKNGDAVYYKNRSGMHRAIVVDFDSDTKNATVKPVQGGAEYLIRKSQIVKKIGESTLETFTCESNKLDKVGKADADIDNDGDVDSSDEYLKNRRAKIKAAMKESAEREKTASEFDSYELYVKDRRAKGLQVIPRKLYDRLKKNESLDEARKKAPKIKEDPLKTARAQDKANMPFGSKYKKKSTRAGTSTRRSLAGIRTRAKKMANEDLNEISFAKAKAAYHKRLPDAMQIGKSVPNPATGGKTSMHVPPTDAEKKLSSKAIALSARSRRTMNKAKNKSKTGKYESISESFSDKKHIDLADGSRISISKEEANVLNSLFSSLDSSNKKAMMKTMTKNKKGFDEILTFAKLA